VLLTQKEKTDEDRNEEEVVAAFAGNPDYENIVLAEATNDPENKNNQEASEQEASEKNPNPFIALAIILVFVILGIVIGHYITKKKK
jgi:hypothetical protein